MHFMLSEISLKHGHKINYFFSEIKAGIIVISVIYVYMYLYIYYTHKMLKLKSLSPD